MKNIKFWCEYGHNSFVSIDMETTTLMGGPREVDSEGRPLYADINCKTLHYQCIACGCKYTRIIKGWKIMFFRGIHDKSISYKESKRKPDFEVDITPDYIKEKK